MEVDVAVDVSAHIKWFETNRTLPLRVTVRAGLAEVSGAPRPYLLRKQGLEAYAAIQVFDRDAMVMGKIFKHSIYKPVSDAARHDLGAIRAAVFSMSYPAPLAYVLPKHELVHPGECFGRYPGNIVKNVLHSVSGNQRCVVCGGAFE